MPPVNVNPLDVVGVVGVHDIDVSRLLGRFF